MVISPHDFPTFQNGLFFFFIFNFDSCPFSVHAQTLIAGISIDCLASIRVFGYILARKGREGEDRRGMINVFLFQIFLMLEGFVLYKM